MLRYSFVRTNTPIRVTEIYPSRVPIELFPALRETIRSKENSSWAFLRMGVGERVPSKKLFLENRMKIFETSNYQTFGPKNHPKPSRVPENSDLGQIHCFEDAIWRKYFDFPKPTLRPPCSKIEMEIDVGKIPITREPGRIHHPKYYFIDELTSGQVIKRFH